MQAVFDTRDETYGFTIRGSTNFIDQIVYKKKSLKVVLVVSVSFGAFIIVYFLELVNSSLVP